MNPFDHGFTVTIDGTTHRVNITREALEGIAADPAGVPSATLFERNAGTIERYARELIRTSGPRADGVYILLVEWIDADVDGGPDNDPI